MDESEEQDESDNFMDDAYDSSSEELPPQKTKKRVTIAPQVKSKPKEKVEDMDDIKSMAARMQAKAEAED